MLQALHWLPLCGFTLLVAPALLGQSASGERPQRLGVQTCDTQCQSTETDCDLACDQVVACVEECKKASEVCVQKCRSAPPGPSDSAKPPGETPPAGSAKAPTVKKAPSEKKPTAPAKAPVKPPAKP